jgi:hypothetical protein
MAGHFRPNAWAQASGGNLSPEIVLNPDVLARGDKHAAATILHEMCHLWQFVFGRHFPKKAYHNQEWADEMIRVGLTPSTTGTPEGARVGQHMSHYITPNGVFEAAWKALEKSKWGFDWHGLPMLKPKKKSRQGKRVKYTDKRTELTCWGRGDMILLAFDPEQFPDDEKILAVLKKHSILPMVADIPEGYGNADENEDE